MLERAWCHYSCDATGRFVMTMEVMEERTRQKTSKTLNKLQQQQASSEFRLCLEKKVQRALFAVCLQARNAKAAEFRLSNVCHYLVNLK